MTLEKTEHYSQNAYRAGDIPCLPSTKIRKRLGDELQPWGDYAGVDPIQILISAAQDVQSCEAANTKFYEDEWWGWNHQRLKFLNGKLGLKALLMIIPVAWIAAIFGGLYLLFFAEH